MFANRLRCRQPITIRYRGMDVNVDRSPVLATKHRQASAANQFRQASASSTHELRAAPSRLICQTPQSDAAPRILTERQTTFCRDAPPAASARADQAL